MRRQLIGVDFVRAQDVGIAGADDRALLEWAANQGRILVTHDVKTIRFFVDERFRKGLPMPGVIFVPQPFSIADIINDLSLMIQCNTLEEMSGSVYTYLPLS